MQGREWRWLGAVLLVLVVWLVVTPLLWKREPEETASETSPVESVTSRTEEANPLKKTRQPKDDYHYDVSPMADNLNAPDSTVVEDLKIVQNLLEAYRGAVRKGNPVGTNAEITRSLCGINDQLYAPLPNDHEAISPEGELLDRWGTPYFFHQLSANTMKVRSAGPDRRLRTDDDLVR